MVNNDTGISSIPLNDSTSVDIPSQSQPPIDNNNLTDPNKVILLDISCNKEWISYVTGSGDIYYLTIRNFKEMALEEEGSKQRKYHYSINISEHIKRGGNNHCKFLSVSPSGEYVAISCFERNLDPSYRVKKPHNPDCLIFKASEKEIDSKCMKIKGFQGRAVFLSRRETLTLALIDLKTIKVYENFPSYTKTPCYWFDLGQWESTEDNSIETLVADDLYVQSVPWMSTDEELADEEIKRLITYTRHIRDNVLLTPSKGGVTRVWSMIEDGVRLTSFQTSNEEHVWAFSKDYKYTATYTKGTQFVGGSAQSCVKIYNIKSGLPVYKLKSCRNESPDSSSEVSHIRFCYDARYLAMAGVETVTKDGIIIKNVVFEVWYIENEQSIYYKTKFVDSENMAYKTIKPLVARASTEVDQANDDDEGFSICQSGGSNVKKDSNGKTSYGQTITESLIIDIDKDDTKDDLNIEWIETKDNPVFDDAKELENNLDDYTGLRCGRITTGEKTYLVRFGKRMVQLWLENSASKDKAQQADSNQARLSEQGKLVYIRAYKGPNYGLDYSFRESWMIHSFQSIKFIKGYPHGRMIVNIKEQSTSETYHTEEIFLPLEQLMVANAAVTNEPASSSSSESTNNSLVTADIRKFNYHQLESACQAMHYLHHELSKSPQQNNTAKKKWENTKTMYEMAKQIATSVVEDIDEESNFFSTIAGSRTLAMLALFADGRIIIKRIVGKDAPISIFSYPRSIEQMSKYDVEDDKSGDDDREASGESTFTAVTYRSSEPKKAQEEYKYKTIAINENVLTVLLEALEYNLYKLLFNRVLKDSKKLGPGCLSALTDALLFLQEEGNNDVLLTSSHKLSYLEIPKDKLCILETEINQNLKVKALQKEYISSFRDLESHATMEQIKKRTGSVSYLLYKAKLSVCASYQQLLENPKRLGYLKKVVQGFWKRRIKQPWRNMRRRYEQRSKNLSKVCVVPLPHFNSYSNFPEDRPKHIVYKNNMNNKKDNNAYVIPYKSNSAFTRVASDQNSNSLFRQGDTVLEVLLAYKWKKFAMWRFWLVICAIHAVYYITYSTGVLFSQELYGFKPGQSSFLDDGRHLASIILMCGSGLTLMGQEIHQFWYTSSFIDYFSSGYNLVDILAFVFPIITLLQLVLGWSHLNEVCSVTTLILWTHGILRLRAVSYFGITLEIIIKLSKSVKSVLFIMLLIVFAFTQAFMVLLRKENDAYFQEQYSGTFYDTSNSLPTAPYGDVTIRDISSSNGFYDVYTSFSQVWFFIYGVWDPITGGDAGDDKMIMALAIAFSLATSLIFMNIVIALMSNTVEEVMARGKKAWVCHFAAVISEIELYWCHKGAKHSRNNNPTYIYYIANYDAVKKHEDDLEDETKKLKEALGISTKCLTCGHEEKK